MGEEVTDPFADLPKHHFGAILADPPWKFKTWSVANAPRSRAAERSGAPKTYGSMRGAPYQTMTIPEIRQLSIKELTQRDCVLFLWSIWVYLPDALEIIEEWGFTYKSCAFCWMKGHARQIELFQDEITPDMLLGYWTRANSEVCLLATRGKPKRLNADVRQGIIAPRREHSRKPDGIHERIERLVAGPYLELFARQTRPGWTTWGNEVGKFDPPPPKSDEYHAMWRKPFDKPELLG